MPTTETAKSPYQPKSQSSPQTEPKDTAHSHHPQSLIHHTMAVSNNIIAFLNFLSLLCSVPIIGAGIWLANRPDNECVRLARWPVLLLGIILLLVSLAGFVGAYWNRQLLLASYLFAMAALISALLIFLVFAFVVTRPDGSRPVPGRAYEEYDVGGFSAWLRHYVADAANWERIRDCLRDSDVCGKLAQGEAYFTAEQFFASDLSPLQASFLLYSFFYLYLRDCHCQ